jgi:uncharacterized protein YjbJ (UPF0337 family)
MNDDRIIGARKELFGKGERVVGNALDDDGLKADGVIDQVSGSIQHGYGQIKDAVSGIVDDAPALARRAVDQGHRLARRTDDGLYDMLGEHRHFYVVAGAIALLAISILYAGRER